MHSYIKFLSVVYIQLFHNIVIILVIIIKITARSKKYATKIVKVKKFINFFCYLIKRNLQCNIDINYTVL